MRSKTAEQKISLFHIVENSFSCAMLEQFAGQNSSFELKLLLCIGYLLVFHSYLFFHVDKPINKQKHKIKRVKALFCST